MCKEFFVAYSKTLALSSKEGLQKTQKLQPENRVSLCPVSKPGFTKYEAKYYEFSYRIKTNATSLLFLTIH
jgi:hypothetical protein